MGDFAGGRAHFGVRLRRLREPGWKRHQRQRVTSPEPVAYDYQNHEREVPSTAEVSLAAVRQALHDFVASDGARPAGVSWQNM